MIKGFTLLECILTITILSLIILLFTGFVITTYGVWTGENAAAGREQKGYLALGSVINQLRKAGEIKIAANRSEIEFKCHYRGRGVKWLNYRIYSSGGVPALGLRIGEETDGKINYAHSQPVINNAVNLKFTEVDESNDLLKIKLTLGDNKKSEEYSGFVVPGGLNSGAGGIE